MGQEDSIKEETIIKRGKIRSGNVMKMEDTKESVSNGMKEESSKETVMDVGKQDTKQEIARETECRGSSHAAANRLLPNNKEYNHGTRKNRGSRNTVDGGFRSGHHLGQQ